MITGSTTLPLRAIAFARAASPPGSLRSGSARSTSKATPAAPASVRRSSKVAWIARRQGQRPIWSRLCWSIATMTMSSGAARWRIWSAASYKVWSKRQNQPKPAASAVRSATTIAVPTHSRRIGRSNKVESDMPQLYRSECSARARVLTGTALSRSLAARTERHAQLSKMIRAAESTMHTCKDAWMAGRIPIRLAADSL